MKSWTESELVDLVVEWVREYEKQEGRADGAVTADTDLIGTGLLDSYGMIDLLMFVESRVGWKIDLTDVDPVEFSVVRGISRITLRNQQRMFAHAGNK
jgi:acyl carrier protein